jgi:hypothetical protein
VVASNLGVDVKTVRKWCARFQAEGPAGLLDRSSRPHHPPAPETDEAAGRGPEAAIEVRKSERMGSPQTVVLLAFAL